MEPDERRDTRNEGAFGEFLTINQQLDGQPDLQWLLHRVYWQKGVYDNRQAIINCAKYAHAYPHANPPIGELYANKAMKKRKITC